MKEATNKIFGPVNALLALVALFTIALTLYSCSKFYTYLPTSDIWIYTDFLAHAAQGKLDVGDLFIKHNNAHLVALPKLVYFFDMYLANGSGRLVMLVSLFALLATTLLFVFAILRNATLEKQEKIFLALTSSILLLSACQVESLLNPANLQWSLLVFAATLTAWSLSFALQKKSALNIAGVLLGIALVTLTSASVLLIIVPLCLLAASKKIVKHGALLLALLVLIGLAIVQLFYVEYLSMLGTGLLYWMKFTIDFLAPPVERLHTLFATTLAGVLLALALYVVLIKNKKNHDAENIFFRALLYFSLFVILATGAVRSYSPTAFTFRFVNLGLLFAASLIPLLYLEIKNNAIQVKIILPIIVFYLGLLSYVNITEASVFGYGRNHVRLTQVAHALDINDSFVVSAMPGTIWEKIDFDTVQANKHKLQEVGTGVYGSEQFKHVGQPISALGTLKSVSCQTTIIKMRRLLPDQAAYRLLGKTSSSDGIVMSSVYFADEKNIIRGYAIPIEPGKNILQNIFEQEQWAGFVNLDNSAEQTSLQLYAYNSKAICQGEKISLPEYKLPEKKNMKENKASE